MRYLPFAAVLAMLGAPAAPVWAQSNSTPEQRADHVGRIEVGAAITGLFLDGWVPEPAVQVRLNVSSRVAVDAVGAFDSNQKHGVSGFYHLQIHQTIGQARGVVTPFATYGVTGRFEYIHEAGNRLRYDTGDTIVYPATHYGSVSGPLAINGGGGVRVRLAPRAFLETGAQLAFAPGGGVLLANVGVMVPLGGVR